MTLSFSSHLQQTCHFQPIVFYLPCIRAVASFVLFFFFLFFFNYFFYPLHAPSRPTIVFLGQPLRPPPIARLFHPSDTRPFYPRVKKPSCPCRYRIHVIAPQTSSNLTVTKVPPTCLVASCAHRPVNAQRSLVCTPITASWPLWSQTRVSQPQKSTLD